MYLQHLINPDAQSRRGGLPADIRSRSGGWSRLHRPTHMLQRQDVLRRAHVRIKRRSSISVRPSRPTFVKARVSSNCLGSSSLFGFVAVRIRSRLRQPNADSISFNGENRSRPQITLMRGQNLDRCRPVLPRADPDEAHDARVRRTLEDRELAEVLVQCELDPTLPIGKRQNLGIPRVRFPSSGPNRVVTGRGDRLQRAAPHAGVEENLHAAEETNRGATRSCATRQRAYSTHASTSSRSIHG